MPPCHLCRFRVCPVADGRPQVGSAPQRMRTERMHTTEPPTGTHTPDCATGNSTPTTNARPLPTPCPLRQITPAGSGNLALTIPQLSPLANTNATHTTHRSRLILDHTHLPRTAASPLSLPSSFALPRIRARANMGNRSTKASSASPVRRGLLVGAVLAMMAAVTVNGQADSKLLSVEQHNDRCHWLPVCHACLIRAR